MSAEQTDRCGFFHPLQMECIMKTLICVGALGLLLSGCANTYTYVKEGANSAALQDDLAACKTVMARHVGDAARDAMDQCMADKGYEKRVDKYRL